MIPFARPDTPGAVVAVIEGGEVTYSKAYGVAVLTLKMAGRANKIDRTFGEGLSDALDHVLALEGADKAFDTKDARKTCFNHAVMPNIDENKRNRKTVKRGRKRFFNAEVYKRRFTCERTFAWIDKFKALLIRFDRKNVYFLGAHFIAFAMINLRHVIQQ